MGNRGARLMASCWSLAAAATILLALRLYAKFRRGRGLWWDDHLLSIAWVALIIAVSINTYLVTLGFGTHMNTISPENLKKINLNTILVGCFGIIATTASKTSFAVTLYRIATNAWMKHFLVFIIVTHNVSMNLVWIFGFAKCTPIEKVWDRKVPGTCWDMKRLLSFQLFAAYYSAILDFVLAFLPWQIIMGMSMLRRERLGVAVAMSLGAIAGITAIVKAVLVVNMKSLDITYDRVDLTIWTLAEPSASIMAVSIPILRMLYRELRSSQRSYFQGKSNPTNNPYGQNTRNGDQNGTQNQPKRYGHTLKYGRNSVVVMTGWQDSQEALQGRDSSKGGVVKTQEVRVHHEQLTTSTTGDDSSIELKNLEPVHRKEDGSSSDC